MLYCLATVAFALTAPCMATDVPPVPLPAELSSLGAGGYIDKQETDMAIYRPGEACDIVADAKASNGQAARIVGSTKDWAVQLRNERLSNMQGTYRCYAVIRCEIKDAADLGRALSMGLYDQGEAKTVVHMYKNVHDFIDGQYHVFDLGSRLFNGQEWFYVAGAENGTAVEGIYVDRFIFIPVAP